MADIPMSTNRFPATCARCGETVEPEDGLVSGGKGADGSWRVVHNSCLPADPAGTPPPDAYAELGSMIFKRPINKHDNPRERQIGKNGLLGSGFGLGQPKPLEFDL